MRRPFWVSGLLGIGLIAMSAVLLVVNPGTAFALPEGFFTPVVAFEFVETAAEVRQLFGPAPTPERAALVRAMDLGSRIDFGYMLLYAAFLAAFCHTAARRSGRRWFYLGAALAVLAAAADAVENMQLLAITARLDAPDLAAAIGRELLVLRWATWLKWGGLAVLFLSLAPYFARGNSYARFVGTFTAVPFVLGVLAFFNRGLLNELFALSVALMFLLLIIYAWTTPK